MDNFDMIPEGNFSMYDNVNPFEEVKKQIDIVRERAGIDSTVADQRARLELVPGSRARSELV